MSELLNLKEFTEENIKAVEQEMIKSNDIIEFKCYKISLKTHEIYLKYINHLLKK